MGFKSTFQLLAWRRLQPFRHWHCTSFRNMGFFFALLLFLGSSLCVGQGTHSGQTKKRPKAASSKIKVALPENACSKEDLEKFAGLKGLEKKHEVGSDLRLGDTPSQDLGMKRFEGAKPSHPLFIQVNDFRLNPDYHRSIGGLSDSSSASDVLAAVGNAPPSHIYKFSHALHPDLEENFSALFSHALQCLEKSQPGFFLELKAIINNSLYTTESREEFSDFFQKIFNANTKKEEPNTEGFNRDLVNTVHRLLLRLESAEALAQEHKSVLPALRTYLANEPTKESLKDLGDQIGSSPHSLEMNGLVAGAIGRGAEAAFFDQRIKFGSEPRLFEKASSPQGENSYPEKALNGISSRLKSFGEALEQVKKQMTSQGGVSLPEAEEIWTGFRKALEKETKALGTEELLAARDQIFEGLKFLDQLGKGSDPLQVAFNREALMRAGHAIERAIPDPAAELIKAEERPWRESFGGYQEALLAFAKSLEDPKFKEANAVIEEAQKTFKGLAVPLASMGGIRALDPFQLGLLKDGNGKLSNESRTFFQTGFSTAWFNPTKNGKIILPALQRALEASGALQGFSHDEKKTLESLLATSSGSLFGQSVPFKGGYENWKKAYEKTREKLFRGLQDELSTGEATAKAKASALAIEMLDSTGNHDVNAYAEAFRGQFSEHYQMEKILGRLNDEQKLREKGGTHTTPSLHGLSPNLQGIPSRARVAEMIRETEPKKKEEAELLQLYRDLLVHAGGGALSKESESALKRLAFENQDPERLLNELELLIPGLGALGFLRGAQEDSLPKGVLSQGPKVKEAQDAVTEAELRTFSKLREAIRGENAKHLPLLKALSDGFEKAPGSFASLLLSDSSSNLLEALSPLMGASPELKDSIDALVKAQQGLERKLQRAQKIGEGSKIPDVAPYLLQAGQGVSALSELRARLGKDHPLVQKYQEELVRAFEGGSQLAQALEGVIKAQASEALEKLKAQKDKRKKYSPLPWDDSIGAFVLTEKTKLDVSALQLIEKEFPGEKFVWRDSRNPGMEEILGLYELKKRFFDHDQSLALMGFEPGNGEWFPIPGSSEMAGRWISKNGERVFQVGSLPELRREMESRLSKTKRLQDAADTAVGIFGHWTHGFKDVAFNPFGLGYDPNEGPEDKQLFASRHRFSQARRELKEFGLLAASGLQEGRNLLEEFEKHEDRLFHNTQSAIQQYVDSAELTGEVGMALGTLPFAALGGSALALSRLPQSARGASVLMGLGRGLLHLNRAAKVAGSFAGVTAGFNALANPQAVLFGDPKEREIESALKAGKEWRKFPQEPSSEDPKYRNGTEFNQKAFEQDWRSWYEEQRWDRNGNGKPDFTEDHLKDYAYRGEKTASNLLGKHTLDTYKGMYGIGLAGSLAPGTMFIPHLAVPTGLEQAMHYLSGAGKPGDFTQRMTGVDALKNTGLAVGAALPAVLAPAGVLRYLPSRFSRELPVNLWGLSNSRQVLGLLSSAAASTATNAAIYAGYGANPLDALSIDQVLMHLYVGHGMTLSAAKKAAEADILALKPEPGKPGQAKLSGPGSQPSQNVWDALAKKHGQKTLDDAVAQLRTHSLDQAQRPDIYRALSEYQLRRADQVLAQSQTELAQNPFKDTPTSELAAKLSALAHEVSGLKGLDLARRDPSAFAAKRAEMKQAEVAFKAKVEVAQFQERARDFQSLEAFKQIRTDLMTKARSQSEWDSILENSPRQLRPFIEELSLIARETPTGTPRWLESARNLARQEGLVGAFMGSIINPHSGGATPEARAQRLSSLMAQIPLETLPRSPSNPNAIDYREQLVRQFVLSTTQNPQVAARLMHQLKAPETTPREVVRDLHHQLSEVVAHRFERYLSNPQRDTSKTLGEHFVDFISTQSLKEPLAVPSTPPPRLGGPQ